MLFRAGELSRIGAGEIRVAFRRWRRPTVTAGGTLTTSVGVLRIESVDRITEGELSAEDALEAGCDGVEPLRTELGKRPEGDLFRIRFQLEGPDPRVELRERNDLTEEEWSALREGLGRLDRASGIGPWTRAALEVVEGGEGVRAGDLAPLIGQEREGFKLNVRKLKKMGLTESLGTGYRVSPRGRTVLSRLRGTRGTP